MVRIMKISSSASNEHFISQFGLPKCLTQGGLCFSRQARKSASTQAESLGDNIGILAHGRLRAFGTSIFLKNKSAKRS